MIFKAIEDFLSQCKSYEAIQVVRKLHAITLQVDPDATSSYKEDETLHLKQEQFIDECGYEEVISEPEDDVDDEIDTQSQTEDDSMIVVSNCFQCLKCEKIAVDSVSLEVHDFFKHSIVGGRINSEVESAEIVILEKSQGAVRICTICSMHLKEAHDLSSHILFHHINDIFAKINESPDIEIDFEIVNKYIEFVKDLLQSKDSKDALLPEVDPEVRKYFYAIFEGYTIESNDQFETTNEQFEIVNEVDGNEAENNDDVVVAYEELFQPIVIKIAGKSSPNISEDSRAWLRKEIGLRKKTIRNEIGGTRNIFRCAYCNVYSSNSAPGFRYHLISKHLKNGSFGGLQEIESDHVPPEKGLKTKNSCLECNLKFKDYKMLSSHQNCHDLFKTIANHYSFPACYTCNVLFIDDYTLNHHLAKHDSGDDVSLAVEVPPGAVFSLGKQIKGLKTADDVPEDDFAFNCGHCTKKFSKDISCRYHLLMSHVETFVCPIDKREFSGFKAVSLFCHHFKNKHSEMFPELIFSCTFCKMEFPSIYDKLSHMKGCSLKKFACDHCGKKFFKKNDLISHMKFVSGELFYSCKICQKKCETLSDLKIHIRCHTKEKPFMCSICRKSFRTLAARSAHLESHVANVTYKVSFKLLTQQLSSN